MGSKLATGVLRRVTAPRVVRHRAAARLIHGLAAAPLLPAGARSSLARRLRAGMVRAGWPAAESRAALAAVAAGVGPAARADLLAQEAADEIAEGRTPAHLTAAVEADLAEADRAYARGDGEAAARRLHRVLHTQFHRVIHFDQLDSPLVDDPAAFLAPLHGSAVGQALLTPRGRRQPAAPPPTDRPQRVLLLLNGSAHFVQAIRERYAAHPGVELRYVRLDDDPVAGPLIRASRRMTAEALLRDTEYGRQVEAWLRPHLDWADTVFVDWAVATAVMVGLVDPGDTRVVVRLHSYEAFGRWPNLIDFSRVDDVVFVSEHLRDFTLRVAPGLTGAHAPRTHVLCNAMDLAPFARPKDPAARFTLGLVGTSAVAKDPRWAIEVLRLLRATDERYRLLLVGGEHRHRAQPGGARLRGRAGGGAGRAGALRRGDPARPHRRRAGGADRHRRGAQQLGAGELPLCRGGGRRQRRGAGGAGLAVLRRRGTRRAYRLPGRLGGRRRRPRPPPASVRSPRTSRSGGPPARPRPSTPRPPGTGR